MSSSESRKLHGDSIWHGSYRIVVAPNQEGHFGKLRDSEAEGPCPTSETGTSSPCSVTEYHGDLLLCALKLTHRMKAMLTVTDPVTIRFLN